MRVLEGGEPRFDRRLLRYSWNCSRVSSMLCHGTSRANASAAALSGKGALIGQTSTLKVNKRKNDRTYGIQRYHSSSTGFLLFAIFKLKGTPFVQTNQKFLVIIA